MQMIVRALIIILTLLTFPVTAATTCNQATGLCTARVNFQRFAREAFQAQNQNQWCWAASIAMVFDYYDHPVSQSRIVSETYGSPVNMPAMGITIAQQMNRDWVDDQGRRFSARLTGAYDVDAGVIALTNGQIVSELDQEHPLVIGNRQHAMVLTEVDYFPTPAGPNIMAGRVFDPWPGVGFRNLNYDELFPMHVGGSLRFLATVRVTDVSTNSSNSSPSSGGGGGCGTTTPDQPVDPTLYALMLLALWRVWKAGHRYDLG